MSYADVTWIVLALEALAAEIVFLVLGLPLLTTSMRDGADRWALWPALFGTLCGHFFGTAAVRYPWAPFLIVPFALAVLGRDLFDRSPLPSSTHMAIFLFFFGLGAALWGSRA